MAYAQDMLKTRFYQPPFQPSTKVEDIDKIRLGNTEWVKMQARSDVTKHTPRVAATFHNDSWNPERDSMDPKASRPMAADNRTDEFYRRYQKLAQNIAYRYPEPGPAREREGRIGGSWRHIKEVQGHGIGRVCFVDGLVRLYDYEKKGANNADLLPVRASVRTPQYGASRHDVNPYKSVLQHEYEKLNTKPGYITTSQAMARTVYGPPPTAAPETGSKYKGFYALRRENTTSY